MTTRAQRRRRFLPGAGNKSRSLTPFVTAWQPMPVRFYPSKPRRFFSFLVSRFQLSTFPISDFASMSDEVIIRVEGLGKRYRISHQGERQRYVALPDVIAQKARGIFSKLKSAKQKAEISEDKAESRKQKSGTRELLMLPNFHFLLSTCPISALPSSEDFWALKDVSFEVKRGEVV